MFGVDWGAEFPQLVYTEKRSDIGTVFVDDIEAICSCGRISLKPHGEFELKNVGLTVMRKTVEILRRDGSEVKSLRSKKIMHWSSCNGCANKW